MKNVLFIFSVSLFLFLFYSNPVVAQGGGEGSPTHFIVFEQTGNSSITYTGTAQSSYWELVEESDYLFSTNSEWEEASITLDDIEDRKGFYFPWLPNPPEEDDFIAYGFYKITNSYNSNYFYIDVRDCNLFGILTNNYNGNLSLRFQTNGGFSWRVGTTGSFTPISNGQLLNIWEINHSGYIQETYFFEDFWDYALVGTNNGSNHPRLNWGPINVDNGVVNYKIYYNVHAYYDPPGTYSYLTTIDNDTFTYTDNSQTLGLGYDDISYKVVARLNDEIHESEFDSDPTNVVTLRLSESSKINAGKSITHSDFSLLQNYPNPFNPTTNITYSTIQKGLVQLKIYDVLGREIATLVNEVKEPGNYSINFNAGNLPSGLYLYKLNNGNYSSTRKMFLIK